MSTPSASSTASTQLAAPRALGSAAGEAAAATLAHSPTDERDPHASCSRSQSATSGRALYGTFAHTWLPSSNSTNSPLRRRVGGPLGLLPRDQPVELAGHEQRRLVELLDHAVEVEALARLRPSSSSAACDLRTKVSRVSGGRWSQIAPKSNGPLIPATARIRGSNAAARGA